MIELYNPNKSYYMAKLNLNQYFYRKILHISSIWIPILYLFTDYIITLLVLLGTTTVVLVLDILRIKPTRMQHKVHELFVSFGLKELLKEKELHSLSGASYMMLSALICMMLFPKSIFIIGYTILCLSDPIAAMTGKKYGSKSLFGKSYEGSIAFMVSALIIGGVGILWFDLNPAIIVACVFFTTLAELLSNKLRINDNILIPLVFGFVWEIFR